MIKEHTKLFVGVLAILFLAAFLFKGEITGNATYCSAKPHITSFKQVSDTVSVDWTDSSTSAGKPKYEVLLFLKQDDGTYDFGNPMREEYADDAFASFRNVQHEKTYVVKVRAINHRSCSEQYSGYAVSEELTVNLGNVEMPKV